MAGRDEIVAYANALLEVERWPEFAPPGLQVIGADEVSHDGGCIHCGVDGELQNVWAIGVSGTDQERDADGGWAERGEEVHRGASGVCTNRRTGENAAYRFGRGEAERELADRGGGFEAAAASILAAAEGSAKIAKASAEGNVIQAGPQGEKNQTNGLKNG